MSNEIEKIKQENLKLKKEIEKLSFNLKKARLNNQKDHIKFERLKFKLEKQIGKLISRNIDLEKKKKGITAAELMSGIGRRLKSDEQR
jgi:hypothetical protein